MFARLSGLLASFIASFTIFITWNMKHLIHPARLYFNFTCKMDVSFKGALSRKFRCILVKTSQIFHN